MFLAAFAQGQGLGPVAASSLAAELTRRGWTNITVDPAVENRIAIKAWGKAGFRPTGRYSEDDGRKTVLMVYSPAPGQA
jgi:aminoglycoside 6'-N-acetyltransferase